MTIWKLSNHAGDSCEKVSQKSEFELLRNFIAIGIPSRSICHEFYRRDCIQVCVHVHCET